MSEKTNQDFVKISGEPVAVESDISELKEEVDLWKKKTRRWRIASVILFLLGLIIRPIIGV